MGDKPLVLVTERIAAAGLSLLQQACNLLTPWADGRAYAEEDLKTADAIIVRLVPVTESLLSVARNLRVIGRHGMGLDNVDLPAATARGIPVVFTPGVNANAVAEHTVNLMLALARHTVAADRLMREGRFAERGSLLGFELRHKTVGIIGFGAIGSRVAEICRKGFDSRVLVFDPYTERRPSQEVADFVPSLRELLEGADIVTLHVPTTPETTHLINAETLRYMKKSALLINTARGSVVDSLALAEALVRGQIRGTALDVFEEEPLPRGHPLLTAPRTVLAPHIASSTHEAMDGMAELVAKQVIQVLRGERPEFVANPEAFNIAAAKKQHIS